MRTIPTSSMAGGAGGDGKVVAQGEGRRAWEGRSLDWPGRWGQKMAQTKKHKETQKNIDSKAESGNKPCPGRGAPWCGLGGGGKGQRSKGSKPKPSARNVRSNPRNAHSQPPQNAAGPIPTAALGRTAASALSNPMPAPPTPTANLSSSGIPPTASIVDCRGWWKDVGGIKRCGSI